MIAFEISVNGHHIRTITIGEFGLLNADLMWHRIQSRVGPIHEGVRLWPHGMVANDGDAVRWPEVSLKAGDVVAIRM